MKITFVANYDITFARFRDSLIQRLEERGFAVELLALSGAPSDGFPRTADPERTKLHHLGCDPSSKRIGPFLKSFWILSRALRQSEADVIFVQNSMSIVLVGLIIKLFGLKSKLVVLVEGLGRGFDRQTKPMWRAALRSADRIIFLNPSDPEKLRKEGVLVQGEAVDMISGIGLDLDRFAHKPLGTECRNVLMIGRMIGTKRPLDFCKAAEMCAGSDITFTLIYEPQSGGQAVREADLQAFAEHVELVRGPVDVMPYLRRASFLCLPSENEGFPVVVMEAAAIGRAALVSDHPTLSNAITPQTGWIFPLGNTKALSDMVQKIFEDQSYLAKGKAARAHAEQQFDRRAKDMEFIRAIELALDSH